MSVDKPEPTTGRALMDEMFATVSYVNDYSNEPLPDVDGEDEDGDPIADTTPQ